MLRVTWGNALNFKASPAVTFWLLKAGLPTGQMLARHWCSKHAEAGGSVVATVSTWKRAGGLLSMNSLHERGEGMGGRALELSQG